MLIKKIDIIITSFTMELLLFAFIWIVHLKMDLNREIIYELYERRKFKQDKTVYEFFRTGFKRYRNIKAARIFLESVLFCSIFIVWRVVGFKNYLLYFVFGKEAKSVNDFLL